MRLQLLTLMTVPSVAAIECTKAAICTKSFNDLDHLLIVWSKISDQHIVCYYGLWQIHQNVFSHSFLLEILWPKRIKFVVDLVQ